MQHRKRGCEGSATSGKVGCYEVLLANLDGLSIVPQLRSDIYVSRLMPITVTEPCLNLLHRTTIALAPLSLVGLPVELLSPSIFFWLWPKIRRKGRHINIPCRLQIVVIASLHKCSPAGGVPTPENTRVMKVLQQHSRLPHAHPDVRDRRQYGMRTTPLSHSDTRPRVQLPQVALTKAALGS